MAVIITVPTFLISRLAALTVTIVGSDETYVHAPVEADVGAVIAIAAPPKVPVILSNAPTVAREKILTVAVVAAEAKKLPPAI